MAKTGSYLGEPPARQAGAVGAQGGPGMPFLTKTLVHHEPVPWCPAFFTWKGEGGWFWGVEPGHADGGPHRNRATAANEAGEELGDS